MTIRQGNKIIAGNINVEDYNTLQNKPQINSVELSGNKTLDDLGIQAKGEYATKAQGAKADTAVQPATLDAYLTTESATSTYATKASLSGYATTSALDGKADKETTLAGYGITDGLSTSQITNCLTKIPQDIKLELSNGTLTLKAGSKVYVPNGVGVFDIITLSADKTTQRTTNGKCMVFINRSASFNIMPFDYCYSGSYAPTITTTYAMWYDTANKKIKWTGDNGSSWTEGLSLPLAVITVSNGAISSIDQVFNGFGYIGNTIFALPGVEGLIPNGRNADGSLNSIESTTTSVLTYTNIVARNNTKISLYNNGIIIRYTLIYDKNLNRNFNGSVYSNEFDCGTVSTDSTGRITSFKPKTTFQAVDYSEYAREVGRCAKKDENNVFTGQNTFDNSKSVTINKGSVNLILRNPGDSWTEDSSGIVRFGGINFRDKNNVDCAFIQASSNSEDARFVELGLRNKENTSTFYYTFLSDRFIIPTPSSSASTIQAVTAAWVRNLFPLKDLSNATTNAGNGYVYIGDLLIQWGSISGQSGVVLDVVFHKPFADPNYYFDSVPHLRSDGYSPAYSSHGFEKTTTSISVVLGGRTASQEWIAIGKKGA